MNIEKINYKSKIELLEVKEFLNDNSLNFDESCDYTVVIRDKQDKIVATASKSKNILKCFAISSSMRGEGVSGGIITNVVNKMFDEGYNNYLVFTKSENIDLFVNMGYKEVATTDKVSLLEMGSWNIEKAIEKIKKEYSLENNQIKRSMLVMNCNPFTLGHQYIIERAAEESEEVIIFVVEEDKSVFPFKVRFELVKKGCSHLKNVKVVPGTNYIISSATFPNYFLKKDDDVLLEYTKLDVTIAAKRFCTAFNITRRYIGEEPYCKMTSKYNDTILELFPKFGIDVKIIKRKENEHKAISATNVREALKNREYEILKNFVPKTTLEFLLSDEAKKIIEKL